MGDLVFEVVEKASNTPCFPFAGAQKCIFQARNIVPYEVCKTGQLVALLPAIGLYMRMFTQQWQSHVSGLLLFFCF